MIGYSHVHFIVWHLNARTMFTMKALIFFEYLFSHNLISNQCTYILMNIAEVAKPDAEDPEFHSEYSNLV